MMMHMASERQRRNEGQDGSEAEAWDAHDPRRQHDPMAPPLEPCECWCMHCNRTFMSDRIWFQKIKGNGEELDGFWMCPTPNCGGAGFTFDIFPTDPDHPANSGWFQDDDTTESAEESWSNDPDADGEFEDMEAEESDYDPDEPRYQMLDEFGGGYDDDLEGEEWKHGLQPGERPERGKPQWVIEEEKKYDAPDERPRELDWTDREKADGAEPWTGPMNDDDIPF